MAAMLLPFSIPAAYRLARQHVRTTNLARYTAPLLTEALADRVRPAFAGRAQQAVAVFVDIEGSTGRSEAAGPEATADLLRRFHGAVERAAAAEGGVVEQFAGDGVMLIFGLPEPGPGDAAAALACIARLLAELGPQGAMPIRVG